MRPGEEKKKTQAGKNDLSSAQSSNNYQRNFHQWLMKGDVISKGAGETVDLWGFYIYHKCANIEIRLNY